MKLSIIIVNYNVKHFLQQCLNSVLVAANHCETEIFVVDNNSIDGSCTMVKENFPSVILIENKTNYGFSYANNQAIKIAKGDYILLLNPDTLIEENTLKSVCDFLDDTPDAGALGVKMIDGNGRFLPESKRGLPTPSVAFYKIFGLSKIFKKSKKFGQYHLSYLDKNEIHKVDVLSGAFMLIRKSVLDKIGLLDETYFMYGEDIDMSYRIVLAGYNNYYYPKTTIIHYKGESTKKGSLNYVFVFYKAMIIFAKKYFTSKRAKLFSFMLNSAIYFRAFLAILYRLFINIITVAVDSIIIIASFFSSFVLWQNISHKNFSVPILIYSLIFILISYILSIAISGGYDKPLKINKLFYGILIGSTLTVIIYSLLPETYRFSRAIIIITIATTLLLVPLTRYLLSITKIRIFKISTKKKNNIAIIGQKDEIQNFQNQIDSNNSNLNIRYHINPNADDDDSFFDANIHQIDDFTRINKIDSIIFCVNNLSTQQIISIMIILQGRNIDYKITSSDGLSIIGNNLAINTCDLYQINIKGIAMPENQRRKRIVDLFFSFILLIFYPLYFPFIKKRFCALKRLFIIFFGEKSFISYASKNSFIQLPKIKNGYFSPADFYEKDNMSEKLKDKVDYFYAKDYNIFFDSKIILKFWYKLGVV